MMPRIVGYQTDTIKENKGVILGINYHCTYCFETRSAEHGLVDLPVCYLDHFLKKPRCWVKHCTNKDLHCSCIFVTLLTYSLSNIT